MAVSTDSPGPYAPAATIMEVVSRFRNRGMQTPFNREVLGRAGVTDSLVGRTLQALGILDLIDDDGNPTEVLERLAQAPEAELQACMADWLRAAYAEVLQFIDPATDDATRVRDAFRSYEPRGQQPRMVTLFLSLCQTAGLRPADADGTPRPRNVQKRARRETPRQQPVRGGGGRRRQQQQTPDLVGVPQPIAGLLASLPASGRWSQKRRDDFVKTFGTVLDFCVEIGDDSNNGSMATEQQQE